MIPADLAALRALIESDIARHRREHVDWQQAHGCGDCSRTVAAQEALERLSAATNPWLEQAERDVAYWRKRAEDAEGRAAREGRDDVSM